MSSTTFSEEPKPTPEYKREVYQKQYQNELVSDFRHGFFSFGPVDVKKAASIVDFLNGYARRKAPGVTFNAKKIHGKLEGGACSAIALRVGREAVALIQAIDEGRLNDRQVKEKLRQYVTAIHAEGANKNLVGRLFRENIRSIQAAFNTINVSSSLTPEVAAKAKVRAIAAYWGLDITTSTQALKITGTSAFEAQLAREMDGLGPGVYLVRIVQPAQNEKREVQGHSTIYIKHSKFAFYFDVNIGLYDISSPEAWLVYHALRGVCNRFQVDTCTFHKLTASGQGFIERKTQTFHPRDGRERG